MYCGDDKKNSIYLVVALSRRLTGDVLEYMWRQVQRGAVVAVEATRQLGVHCARAQRPALHGVQHGAAVHHCTRKQKLGFVSI